MDESLVGVAGAKRTLDYLIDIKTSIFRTFLIFKNKFYSNNDLSRKVLSYILPKWYHHRSLNDMGIVLSYINKNLPDILKKSEKSNNENLQLTAPTSAYLPFGTTTVTVMSDNEDDETISVEQGSSKKPKYQ